jgi:hypothetical protein
VRHQSGHPLSCPVEGEKPFCGINSFFLVSLQVGEVTLLDQLEVIDDCDVDTSCFRSLEVFRRRVVQVLGLKVVLAGCFV